MPPSGTWLRRPSGHGCSRRPISLFGCPGPAAISVTQPNGTLVAVKLTVQVRLGTTTEQMRSLLSTLVTCNQAANAASQVAFANGAARRHMSMRSLQKLAYDELKLTLSAQPSLLTISKVAAAYSTLRANLREGRYGKPGSKRRARVEAKPVRFRSDAAQPYDDRCLSWQHSPTDPARGTVSIWTVDGRLKDIAYVGQPGQVAMLRSWRQGETDLLVRRDGAGAPTAFLVATVDVPAGALADGPHLFSPEGWVGVDMGIENIAVTSDRPLAKELMGRFGADATDGPGGEGKVSARRKKNRQLREKLQKKGTKSAKRLLKKRSRKESRFAADVNHQISKRIVAEAKRTGRGIAREDLTGIRERVRLRKPQRATHSSWAFAQLAEFLDYKAAREGVPMAEVDPANTSRRCTRCGHTEKGNRPSQAEFCCRACGFVEHADLVGADNIAYKAPQAWAQSTVPSAA